MLVNTYLIFHFLQSYKMFVERQRTYRKSFSYISDKNPLNKLQIVMYLDKNNKCTLLCNRICQNLILTSLITKMTSIYNVITFWILSDCFEADKFNATILISKMKLLTYSILVTIIIPSYFSNAGKVLFYSPVSTKSYRVLYNPILKELER